jgi:hypothetical protein
VSTILSVGRVNGDCERLLHSCATTINADLSIDDINNHSLHQSHSQTCCKSRKRNNQLVIKACMLPLESAQRTGSVQKRKVRTCSGGPWTYVAVKQHSWGLCSVTSSRSIRTPGGGRQPTSVLSVPLSTTLPPRDTVAGNVSFMWLISRRRRMVAREDALVGGETVASCCHPSPAHQLAMFDSPRPNCQY